MLSFGTICLLTSMTMLAELSGGIVYGQNSNENGTSTNVLQSGAKPSAGLNSLTIDHARGVFTSLQTDADNVTWIATGKWNLVSDPINASQSNSSIVEFNATIDMRNINDSQRHRHKISGFNLLDSSVTSESDGSTIVFKGTASVDTDVGVYSDVPITIKLLDNAPAIVSIGSQTNQVIPEWIPGGGTISLLIDERVQDHFGDTPVYGEIRKR